MDRNQAEVRLAKLAPEIADALGWQIVPRDDYPHSVEMEAPEGFHVFFHAGYDQGYDKMSISGAWPRDSKGQQVMPAYNSKMQRIRVALTRTAEAVATEVKRRFLPDYIPLWEQAMECLRSHDEYQDATMTNALKLAKIVGVPKNEIREGKFSLYRSSKFPESLSDVKVSGEGVTLDLRCTLEEAQQILEMLVEISR